MQVIEIWRPVKNYEGLYEVSNLGKVRSLNRTTPHSTFGTWTRRGMILKQSTDSYGYNVITLRAENKSKVYKVHRLVCFAFIFNPTNKPQVNHLNGIKTDNKVENLEWCTHQENTDHKCNVLNAQAKGSGVGSAKLTRAEVETILYINATTSTPQTEIARKFKIALSTVERIVLNHSWKHINRTVYNFMRKTINPLKRRKLSDQDIREIRQTYSRKKITMTKLAESYGISIATVSLVINRKKYYS